MNGNGDTRKAHRVMPQEDARLRIQPEADEHMSITTPHNTHEYIETNDNCYVIAYTDGSAFNTQCIYGQGGLVLLVR